MSLHFPTLIFILYHNYIMVYIRRQSRVTICPKKHILVDVVLATILSINVSCSFHNRTWEQGMVHVGISRPARQQTKDTHTAIRECSCLAIHLLHQCMLHQICYTITGPVLGSEQNMTFLFFIYFIQLRSNPQPRLGLGGHSSQ